MKKIKIGIISPSEIAFRRFLPALEKHDGFEFVGVAYPNKDNWNNADDQIILGEKVKASKIIDAFGGKLFCGYKELIEDSTIDAVYIPLPPALHHYWGKLALLNGKHVFIEKPSTTSLLDTLELIKIAKESDLALHENYMFQYHDQVKMVQKVITEGKIGTLKMLTGNFGFPKRAAYDFRYNKELGGGALLDCGGYPLKLVSMLLGKDLEIVGSKLNYDGKDVDMFGSVLLSTESCIANVSFGMDNAYKCYLEIWGSEGTIKADRIFTAPEGLETVIEINSKEGKEEIKVLGDDSFYKSIEFFKQCIDDKDVRVKEYENMLAQMRLVQTIISNNIDYENYDNRVQ